jgi:hypothetical protein
MSLVSVLLNSIKLWSTSEVGSLIGFIFTGVPGQYFCTYTGEDVQELIIPVAEVSLSEFTGVQDQVAQGEQIYVTLSLKVLNSNNVSSLLFNYARIIFIRIFCGDLWPAIR